MKKKTLGYRIALFFHKLLGAFSQASMLHVKDGTKNKVDFVVFDEHSVFYGIGI